MPKQRATARIFLKGSTFGCDWAMTLPEALALFRRLGVNPASISAKEFSLAYYRLAKRYHPDISPRTADLMANINAARNVLRNEFAMLARFGD